MSKTNRFSKLFACLGLAAIVSGTPGFAARPEDQKKWTNRLIPMPQKIDIKKTVRLSCEDISLAIPPSIDPLVRAAEGILRPLARGRGFEIRLALTSGDCPADLREALAKVPNNDQAYAIRPVFTKKRFRGLLLAANTPLGLLYASRTLDQLASAAGAPCKGFDLPLVDILDWPDLAERGEWGGNAAQDLAWMADRKLNVVEVHSNLGFNEDGSPKASLDAGLLEQGARTGIKIVPIILHLEQLAGTGLFKFHPEVAAVPEPGKPLPTDYTPPVCFSKPRTIELLAGWMGQLLEMPGIREVDVWLSEMENRCHCPGCAGREPFVLETQGIISAFDKIKTAHPGSILRILLTQASYDSNGKILAAVKPETRVIYYDGGRTYDSSHRPMIYPLLEDYARSGRWLGVYPQLTNSWRTVFPFTGPQFIRARMQEFVDKGLRSIIGYATPSNRYYEFNVTAAAEWSWNSRGRTAREFSEAYATRKGMNSPGKFAEWAEAIGPAGWKLAGSRPVEGLIFRAGEFVFRNGLIVDADAAAKFGGLHFGEGILAEFESDADLQESRALARRALRMAEKMKAPAAVNESLSVAAALDLLSALKAVSDASALPDEPLKKQRTGQALAAMDDAAKIFAPALYEWGMLVNPQPRGRLASRFRDTVDAAAHAVGAARLLGAGLGIEDPHPDFRRHPVLEWKDEDFDYSPTLVLWADVTGLAAEPGAYDVTLQFTEGASGVETHGAAFFRGKNRESAGLLDEDKWNFRIGRFDRYVDYWLSVPREKGGMKTGERLFLKVEITGPGPGAPSGRRTSRGVITLRKSWRPAA